MATTNACTVQAFFGPPLLFYNLMPAVPWGALLETRHNAHGVNTGLTLVLVLDVMTDATTSWQYRLGLRHRLNPAQN